MLLVDTKVNVQYKNGGIRMEKIPNAVYTKEFREEAVRMVLEHNISFHYAFKMEPCSLHFLSIQERIFFTRPDFSLLSKTGIFCSSMRMLR